MTQTTRKQSELGQHTAMATVAVRDMSRARAFYEETLGLAADHHEGDQAVSYRVGNAHLLVYVSQFAGSNRATAATFMVESDLEQLVESLKLSGISFEQYDMPGMTRKGDVHYAGSLKNAWFKDPDGNIIALVSA